MTATYVGEIRKPCEHGKYINHTLRAPMLGMDAVVPCPGGRKPTTAELLAELVARDDIRPTFTERCRIELDDTGTWRSR